MTSLQIRVQYGDQQLSRTIQINPSMAIASSSSLSSDLLERQLLQLLGGERSRLQLAIPVPFLRPLSSLQDIADSLLNLSQAEPELPNSTPESLISKYPISDAGKSETCSICLQDDQDNLEEGKYRLTLPCHHIFHPNCIRSWLANHNTCPVCRFCLTDK